MFLFRPSGGHHDILANMWTGERSALSAGDWRIGFDSDGAAILLDPEGEPRLAADVLRLRLQVEQGSLSIVGEGAQVSLQQRFNEHVTKFVCLRSLGSEGVAIEVAQFANPVVGARVWWSLPSIHLALGLGANAARWFHRSWQQWRAQVLKLGLVDPHMRRSATTKNSQRIIDDLPDKWVEDVRCLPWYSVSSFALVALLCRWSICKWQRSDMDRLRAFQVCLTAVCENFLTGDFQFEVFARPVVAPGVPLQGDESVQLSSCAGIVDLSGLLASAHPVFREWSSQLALRARGVRWACAHLLRNVFQGGVALEPLFAQLVHTLGALVDSQVCGEAGDQTAPDSFGVVVTSVAKGTESDQCRFNKKMIQRVRDELAKRMAERRLQYFLACRSQFSGADVNYSIAVDGSRMGQKSVIAGFVANAGGVCAVCPPQAFRTHGGCDHLHSTRPPMGGGQISMPRCGIAFGSAVAGAFRCLRRPSSRTKLGGLCITEVVLVV